MLEEEVGPAVWQNSCVLASWMAAPHTHMVQVPPHQAGNTVAGPVTHFPILVLRVSAGV